ncbi:MAG: NUDIX hydrolase [Rhizobiaceae bacterium]
MAADRPPVADTHLPITIESSDISHEGFRQVISYQYREDDSGHSARREIVRGQHAVAVVAHDPKIDQLVMIRQFRIGAQLGVGKGLSVELAAGLIDEGEDAATAAARELKEETGLEALSIKPMCQFLTTPGLTDEVLHIYYAEVNASNLASEAGHASESEQTFPFLLSLDEVLAAIDSNAINNGIVMVGVMWFARHRDQLVKASS